MVRFAFFSGLSYGPYGGTGGYKFTAQPPKSQCYLAWISGQAHIRIDSISFHWRCPVREHSEEHPMNEDWTSDESLHYTRSESSNSPYTLNHIFIVMQILKYLFL